MLKLLHPTQNLIVDKKVGIFNNLGGCMLTGEIGVRARWGLHLHNFVKMCPAF